MDESWRGPPNGPMVAASEASALTIDESLADRLALLVGDHDVLVCHAVRNRSWQSEQMRTVVSAGRTGRFHAY